jgi:hypothetical protein
MKYRVKIVLIVKALPLRRMLSLYGQSLGRRKRVTALMKAVRPAVRTAIE